MFKRKCKITFVSHGATIYTLEGIIGNDLKYPKLNDCGENEIKKVCEYLKDRGVAYDNIYTCPNVCCTQSAHVIAKLFKQKEKIIELAPRNFGGWKGMMYNDILKEIGTDFFTKTPKGGESLKVFNKRVKKVIDKLISENIGSRIIIVTTPEIIQSALADTLGLEPENQHRILIKTGSLTQISYFEDWSSVIYSGYCPL